jgi:hypothetical protein
LGGSKDIRVFSNNGWPARLFLAESDYGQAVIFQLGGEGRVDFLLARVFMLRTIDVDDSIVVPVNKVRPGVEAFDQLLGLVR